MFVIRSNTFETNSSDCNVFVFYENDTVNIPTSIELPTDKDFIEIGKGKNLLDYYFNVHYTWSDCLKEEWEYIRRIIGSLYAIGVKDIKCDDPKVMEIVKDIQENGYDGRFIAGSSSTFANIFFGSKSIAFCESDHSEWGITEKYGPDAKSFHIRLT